MASLQLKIIVSLGLNRMTAVVKLSTHKFDVMWTKSTAIISLPSLTVIKSSYVTPWRGLNRVVDVIHPTNPAKTLVIMLVNEFTQSRERHQSKWRVYHSTVCFRWLVSSSCRLLTMTDRRSLLFAKQTPSLPALFDSFERKLHLFTVSFGTWTADCIVQQGRPLATICVTTAIKTEGLGGFDYRKRKQRLLHRLNRRWWIS